MTTFSIADRLDAFDPDEPDPEWPITPDELREAWAFVESSWADTVDRARRLDPALLHESVGGEWSFIQTLRHLVYATDLWINRVILGDPRPWDRLSLPFDELTPHPEVPADRDARPDLDEVLALRADRQGTVRRFLADVTPQRLAGTTEPVEGPSYPPAGEYGVWLCVATVLNEEWRHRQFAVRDLDALTAGAFSAPTGEDR